MALTKDGELDVWGCDFYHQQQDAPKQGLISTIAPACQVASVDKIKIETAGLDKDYDYKVFASYDEYNEWYQAIYKQQLMDIGLPVIDETPKPILLPNRQALFIF